MRSNLLAGFLTMGVCLGLAIGLPSHVHAGLVVDNFLTPGDGSAFYAPGHPSMVPEYPNNPYFRQDSGVGILGGQGRRELLLEVVGDGPFPFNAAVGWMPPGELQMATFGEQGARLDLTYISDSGAIDLTSAPPSIRCNPTCSPRISRASWPKPANRRRIRWSSTSLPSTRTV